MFTFATCEVNRGIEFINKMYPTKEDLTRDDVPLLWNLLTRDIVRVQDPDFHRPCQIIAGNNYQDSHNNEIQDAINQLKNHPKIK
jgi:carbamate kinase